MGHAIVERSSATLLTSTVAACGRAFAAVVLFSMGINLLMLAAPIYMLQVFDRVLASRSIETLVLLTAMAVFAILTLAALEAVRNHVLVKVSVWLDHRLGGALLAAGIVGGPGRSSGGSGEGLRDLVAVRNFLTGPAVHPILDAPWTPIFVVVIFMLHAVLGWVALGGALLLFALAIANELATRRPLRQSSGEMSRAVRSAEAATRNADAIEAMGMLPTATKCPGGRAAGTRQPPQRPHHRVVQVHTSRGSDRHSRRRRGARGQQSAHGRADDRRLHPVRAGIGAGRAGDRRLALGH